jgi:hypothetical protein
VLINRFLAKRGIREFSADSGNGRRIWGFSLSSPGFRASRRGCERSSRRCAWSIRVSRRPAGNRWRESWDARGDSGTDAVQLWDAVDAAAAGRGAARAGCGAASGRVPESWAGRGESWAGGFAAEDGGGETAAGADGAVRTWTLAQAEWHPVKGGTRGPSRVGNGLRLSQPFSFTSSGGALDPPQVLVEHPKDFSSQVSGRLCSFSGLTKQSREYPCIRSRPVPPELFSSWGRFAQPKKTKYARLHSRG